mgnify:CR=1
MEAQIRDFDKGIKIFTAHVLPCIQFIILYTTYFIRILAFIDRITEFLGYFWRFIYHIKKTLI